MLEILCNQKLVGLRWPTHCSYVVSTPSVHGATLSTIITQCFTWHKTISRQRPILIYSAEQLVLFSYLTARLPLAAMQAISLLQTGQLLQSHCNERRHTITPDRKEATGLLAYCLDTRLAATLRRLSARWH